MRLTVEWPSCIYIHMYAGTYTLARMMLFTLVKARSDRAAGLGTKLRVTELCRGYETRA